MPYFLSSGFLLGVNSSGPVMSMERSGFFSSPESSAFGAAAAGFGAAGAGLPAAPAAGLTSIEPVCSIERSGFFPAAAGVGAGFGAGGAGLGAAAFGASAGFFAEGAGAGVLGTAPMVFSCCSQAFAHSGQIMVFLPPLIVPTACFAQSACSQFAQ